MIKFKYDNKPFSRSQILTLDESSDIFYINLRDEALTVNHRCYLEVKNSNGQIEISREIPKNATDDVFPMSTYFVYQLTNQEVKYIDVGRYDVTLRITDEVGTFSKIVFKGNLQVKV